MLVNETWHTHRELPRHVAGMCFPFQVAPLQPHPTQGPLWFLLLSASWTHLSALEKNPGLQSSWTRCLVLTWDRGEWKGAGIREGAAPGCWQDTGLFYLTTFLSEKVKRLTGFTGAGWERDGLDLRYLSPQSRGLA